MKQKEEKAGRSTSLVKKNNGCIIRVWIEAIVKLKAIPKSSIGNLKPFRIDSRIDSRIDKRIDSRRDTSPVTSF